MASKKAKGKRAKTRHSHRRRTAKLSVNKLLKEFKTGTSVQVNINPSVHSGIPFRRYQGISGRVIGTQGRAVKVALRNHKAKRTLIVHPAHLKELQESKNKTKQGALLEKEGNAQESEVVRRASASEGKAKAKVEAVVKAK